MRRGRSLTPPVCLIALLSCVLSACGPTSGQSRGTLRIPIYGPFHVPDPARSSSGSDLFVDSLLYSGLVKFSPDLHVIPELAVSIPTISENGLTYTFTIRRDARFADGHPVTAQDVAYSLARALRVGDSGTRGALGDIQGATAVERTGVTTLAGVTVVHRLTLRIRLSAPDADFLQELAFPAASVVDRRVVADHPMDTWPSAPNGTGPWVVETRSRDGSISLVPRPHYYGSLQIRSLTLVPVRDVAAGLTLYRRGALDMAQVPARDIERVSSHADFHQSTGLSAYYALPISGDARRLAASLDRDALVQRAGLGLATLQGIVPPSVPDYVSTPPAIDAGTDPSDTSLPVGIAVRRDSGPTILALKAALAGQWPRVSTAGRARVRIVRVSHLLPDPGVWLRVVLPQTRSSWFRWSLASANRLTNDPVDRMDTYDTCERWALTRGYVIPLAVDSVAYLVKPSVEGMQVTPVGMMPDNNNWSSAAVA